MDLMCLKQLEGCEVINGNLIIPSVTSERELKQISDALRCIILGNKLPHWKIIGVYIQSGDSRQVPDFVTKGIGVGRSYAELLPVLRDVVVQKGGGIPYELGKAQSEYEQVNGEQVSHVISTRDDVATDNNSLVYECSGEESVKCLIQNVNIVNFDKGSAKLRLLLYKGTGTVSFEEASAVIRSFKVNASELVNPENLPGYVPFSQVYDLTTSILVKVFMPGDGNIKLFYKKKIDERVLQSILQEFARELDEEELKAYVAELEEED